VKLPSKIELEPEKALDQIKIAAKEVDTAPSEKQIEAGNYKKGHISIQGLPITIENPKGSTRKGTDESGQKWETKIKHHYGYVKRTEGKDGDQVDVFIGPNPESEKAFVVDQVNPGTKVFDEHKVMLGFETEEEARTGYLANYDKSGESRIGTITETNTDEFKTWLDKGNTKKPFAKKDKVTTLITKPIQEAYKKLHDDIDTRITIAIQNLWILMTLQALISGK
jgi:hypothetical protein